MTTPPLRTVTDALEALDAPPPMPEEWITVGRWLGLDKSADSRSELIERYAGSGTDSVDGIALCPDDGEVHDHDPGKCWENDEAPGGCWQTIYAVHEFGAVPVVRDDRIGWSAVMHHDHDPGPGGRWVVPTATTDEFGCRACGAWNCGGVIVHGYMDVEIHIADDVDDETRAEMIIEWTTTGRTLSEELTDILADL